MKTEMTTGEVAREFERFGWNVSVNPGYGLVEVSRGGALLCGDGRSSTSDLSYFFGPKLFGGVLGLAALLAMEEGQSEFGIPTLSAAMNYGHYVPGLHDVRDEEVHCGQQIIAMQGGVYPTQAFTPQEGRDYVLRYGGVQVSLSDNHAETIFGVNMIERTTRLPSALDQQFHNDFWFISGRIRAGIAVEAATRTIERLGSPVRQAVIYTNEY